MQKRIILAAGHGGGDSGAVGQGTTEAAEVIEIVNLAAQKFKADGQVEVVVVPHELNLIDEINWVNGRYQNVNDGYALEVHKNATVNAHGVEGWYFTGDEASKDAIEFVVEGVVANSKLPFRFVKPDNENRWGRLGWIQDTNTAAGLLECGFVSDGGDPVGTKANGVYAQGIFEGVLALFGLSPVPAPVTQLPAQVQISYRVYNNDKQIGAYQKEENAWNKYVADGGVRIVDANGADVTHQFVAKFRPTVEPTPVPTPAGDLPVETPVQEAPINEETPVKFNVAQYSKTIVAVLGFVLTALGAVYSSSPVYTSIVALAVALGVYAVPNKK